VIGPESLIDHNVGVAKDRDIQTFDERSKSYDEGWLGQWHGDVVDRVAALARRSAPGATRVLDVGCGTGLLLEKLLGLLPKAASVHGVDPAPGMVEQASVRAAGRFEVRVGTAEQLPFPDASMDLVVTSMSFDHWADQQAGLNECRRVLRQRGILVLADLCAAWMLPTTLVGRGRGRARTPRVMIAMCVRAGLKPQILSQVQRVGPLPVVQAIVAER